MAHASRGTLVARSPIAAGRHSSTATARRAQKTPRPGVSTKSRCAVGHNSKTQRHQRNIDTHRWKPIINVTVRPETCSVTAADYRPEPDKESANACIPGPNTADRYLYCYDLPGLPRRVTRALPTSASPTLADFLVDERPATLCELRLHRPCRLATAPYLGPLIPPSAPLNLHLQIRGMCSHRSHEAGARYHAEVLGAATARTGKALGLPARPDVRYPERFLFGAAEIWP